jgi:hypothetical protein
MDEAGMYGPSLGYGDSFDGEFGAGIWMTTTISSAAGERSLQDLVWRRRASQTSALQPSLKDGWNRSCSCFDGDRVPFESLNKTAFSLRNMLEKQPGNFAKQPGAACPKFGNEK